VCVGPPVHHTRIALHFMLFEVFIAMKTWTVILWVLMACSHVGVRRGIFGLRPMK
jgi:hypothetical protein